MGGSGFSGWLQKALNDGETKAGAFDIYVMDDLWVPRFAGAGYLANLEELGFRPDADFLRRLSDLGYWPPKTGLRQPGIDSMKTDPFFASVSQRLQILFYRRDIFGASSPLVGKIFSAWRAKNRIPASASMDGSPAERAGTPS